MESFVLFIFLNTFLSFTVLSCSHAIQSPFIKYAIPLATDPELVRVPFSFSYVSTCNVITTFHLRPHHTEHTGSRLIITTPHWTHRFSPDHHHTTL